MASTVVGEKIILAIDLGTSGPKVGLVSTSGRVLAHEFEPVQLLLLPGGGAEQNPHDWWRAITSASQRLLAAHPVPIADIAGVNCTAQWAGTVPVGRDGRPLMNAVIWLDTRGGPYTRELVGGRVTVQGYDPIKAAEWIRLFGGPPVCSGKDPAGHILFNRHERPDVYRETYKFLEPLDYLNLRLTGLFASSYETIAQHFSTDNRDINAIHYDDRLIKMSEMPREKLPDLRPTASLLGSLTAEAAADLGLSPGVPVVTGTPDLHSAAIGSGAVADFAPHLYVGTSSWLLCHVPFKKTDPLHNIGSLPAGIPGRYLGGCVQETGGACLTFLAGVLFGEDQAPGNRYARLDELAERAPAGSKGVIFTPWLFGERAPFDDSTVRGGFHNLSLSTDQTDMVRAVFEGVALNTRWGLDHAEHFVGRRLDEIRAIGGGARSAIWCQIFADVLDRTVLQMEEPQLCNVRGAALQAIAALGHSTFEGIAERAPVAASFTPELANRRIYAEIYAEFGHLFHQNRSIYARLNGRKTPQA